MWIWPNPCNIEAAVKSNTKAIYTETPSNPLSKITDLKAVADIARAHKPISLADNTFATPYLQRPIEYGFDIALHSATKFLNGHSDVLAGIAVAADEKIASRLKFVYNAFGAGLGVQDSWLLRGVKTLGVRMRQSQQSAGYIAHELAKLPEIEQVYYPGLEDHPGYTINSRQSAGAGAVISFRLDKNIKNISRGGQPWGSGKYFEPARKNVSRIHAGAGKGKKRDHGAACALFYRVGRSGRSFE